MPLNSADKFNSWKKMWLFISFVWHHDVTVVLHDSKTCETALFFGTVFRGTNKEAVELESRWDR